MLSLALFQTSGFTQQLSFSSQGSDNLITYSYSFKTINGDTSKLEFAIDKEITEQSQLLFSREHSKTFFSEIDAEYDLLVEQLNIELIKKYSLRFEDIVEQRKKSLPSWLKLELHRTDDGYKYTFRTEGQYENENAKQIVNQMLSELAEISDQLSVMREDEFHARIAVIKKEHYTTRYKEHFYFIDYSQQDQDGAYALLFDYPNIAQHYTKSLRPLSTAISEKTLGMNQREVINYTLAFIQSIPTPDDETNLLDDFVSPVTLFKENNGDCDSKTTALASILRNIYPDLKMVFIIIPNHTLLAIELSSQESGIVITYDGTQYLMLEAAGTKLLPAGEIFEESLDIVLNKPQLIQHIDPIPFN